MGRLRRGGDAPRVVGFDFAALAAARPAPEEASGAPRPAVAPPPSWVRAAAPPGDGLRPTRRRTRPAPRPERAAS